MQEFKFMSFCVIHYFIFITRYSGILYVFILIFPVLSVYFFTFLLTPQSQVTKLQIFILNQGFGFPSFSYVYYHPCIFTEVQFKFLRYHLSFPLMASFLDRCFLGLALKPKFVPFQDIQVVIIHRKLTSPHSWLSFTYPMS